MLCKIYFQHFLLHILSADMCCLIFMKQPVNSCIACSLSLAGRGLDHIHKLLLIPNTKAFFFWCRDE